MWNHCLRHPTHRPCTITQVLFKICLPHICYFDTIPKDEYAWDTVSPSLATLRHQARTCVLCTTPHIALRHIPSITSILATSLPSKPTWDGTHNHWTVGPISSIKSNRSTNMLTLERGPLVPTHPCDRHLIAFPVAPRYTYSESATIHTLTRTV